MPVWSSHIVKKYWAKETSICVVDDSGEIVSEGTVIPAGAEERRSWPSPQ